MHQLKYTPLAFAVILSACCVFCGYPAATAQNEMGKASFARTSLDNYINNALSPQNIGNFGFKNMGDARKAELGTGIQMLGLELKEVKNYREGNTIATLKADTETTWFPVTVSGEVVAKLEILEKEGKMIPGDFGAAAQAQRIADAIASTSGTLVAKGIGVSGALKILRVSYMKADFIYVSGDQGEYLVPAMPLPGRFELVNGKMYPAAEVMALMKKYAQQIEEGMIR
jgi:hypothetical protein